MKAADSNPAKVSEKALERVQTILVILIGSLAVIAFVFTWAQWYPATYAIEWLTNEKGYFSFPVATLLNLLLLLLPLLVAGLIAVVIKLLFSWIKRLAG